MEQQLEFDLPLPPVAESIWGLPTHIEKWLEEDWQKKKREILAMLRAIDGKCQDHSL